MAESQLSRFCCVLNDMSPSNSRSSASRDDDKGGPTLIQRPQQHEGLRRALASSFTVTDEDGDFKGLLGRLR